MCRCSQSHSHTPRPHLLTPFSYHIYGISYLRPCALDWVLCPPLVPFVLRVLARALAVILCVHCDTHDRCAKEWRTIRASDLGRARLRTSAFIKRTACIHAVPRVARVATTNTTTTTQNGATTGIVHGPHMHGANRTTVSFSRMRCNRWQSLQPEYEVQLNAYGDKPRLRMLRARLECVSSYHVPRIQPGFCRLPAASPTLI